MKNMLRLISVTKSYTRHNQDVLALDGANLSIEPGEFVAVVGPSGSGKSTLLLVLGAMLSPTAGRVVIDGMSAYDLSVAARAELRRRKIGFVFQTFNLVPYLTALENVQVPLYLSGVTPEDQLTRAGSLLERVGLGNRFNHKPGELSVGQQQRVALARMLANDPPIILADEPTGNLDPKTGNHVLSFLEELNAHGRTVVMVTHDMRAAHRATRTLYIDDGQISDFAEEQEAVAIF